MKNSQCRHTFATVILFTFSVASVAAGFEKGSLYFGSIQQLLGLSSMPLSFQPSLSSETGKSSPAAAPMVPLTGTISLATLGTPYTQNFDSLASTGTSSTAPNGWAFSESGTSANTTYTAGTGSSSTGDTYSFGSASSTERAFGGLQSGSLIPTIGASFTNNTGATITSLLISYTGEQWRLGASGRGADRIDFQYSTDATGLTNGTWTDVDTLDFSSPNLTPPGGLLDGNAAGNRTAITSTISSLNIPNGATFWIRWNDFNATNSDDALAVDDFGLTPQGTVVQPGAVDFDHATYSQDEFGGNANITLQRTGGNNGAVSVQATLSNNTATGGSACGAGVDYVNTGGPFTVNFADGQTTASFNVPICNDTLWEPGGPETVSLSLSGPTGGATIGGQSTAVLNIIDDDVQPSIQLSSATYSASEGGGTATVTVTRTNATENPVSVNFATSDGTATGGACGSFSGNDYVPASGTLNFAAGDTSKTFNVSICDDNLFESSETVNVALNTIVGASIGTPNTAILTIAENDTAPTVQFSATAASVGESTGLIALTASRTGATENAFTVNYQTADGTATAGPCGSGGDYNSASGTLNFAAGDTSKTFNVTICDDSLFEGDQTFTVTLSGLSSPAVVGTNAIETVTITDNDQPAIQFSSSVYSGPEGSSVIVTVTRTGDFSISNTVDYTVSDGTATGGTCGTTGADYAPASNTLIFGAGDTSKTFQVPLCSDLFSENPAETVNLALSNPTNGMLGVQTMATINILDAATQFANPAPITTTDGSVGTPYPSTINVTGMPGQIGGLRLTLFNVTRASSGDLWMLLVDPSDTRGFIFMAGAGGASPLNGATITLEDSSAFFLPNTGPIAAGQNYKPTNCAASLSFPAPAPAGPYGDPGCGPGTAASFTSVFSGAVANGAWKLYVFDSPGAGLNLFGSGASIGGWGIQFLTPTAAPATLSGQVRTATGRGIGSAYLIVSGGNLVQPVMTRTSSFGYFTVRGLTVGQAYIVSINSRRYTFTPSARAVQLFQDVAGFDFVADQ